MLKRYLEDRFKKAITQHLRSFLPFNLFDVAIVRPGVRCSFQFGTRTYNLFSTPWTIDIIATFYFDSSTRSQHTVSWKYHNKILQSDLDLANQPFLIKECIGRSTHTTQLIPINHTQTMDVDIIFRQYEGTPAGPLYIAPDEDPFE